MARTPEMLDVLQRAGVVDAGGAGLVEIARGIVYGGERRGAPGRPVRGGRPSAATRSTRSSPSYRYCTGSSSRARRSTRTSWKTRAREDRRLAPVVGDDRALKVHVHTDDPGAGALARDGASESIEGVEIANMHHQTAQREERLPEGASTAAPADADDGLVAVAPGRGQPAAVREPRRDARDRGRPVDEPVGEGDPRRHRGGSDAERPRPSEQLERHPHRTSTPPVR